MRLIERSAKIDLMTVLLMAACAGPKPGEVARPCNDHETIVVAGTSALIEVIVVILIAALISTVVISRLRRPGDSL